VVTIKVISEPQQLHIVQELAHNIWPYAYAAILSEEQIQYMLGLFYNIEALKQQVQQGHTFVLAYNQLNTPIGFASYSPEQAGKVKLQKLYVLPTIKGSGVGGQLLQYIIQQVELAACKQLYLNVNKYNEALHFYKHYGFITIAEEVIDIGEGYIMDDYIMALNFIHN
jgi:diamine N-acetyltransferase